MPASEAERQGALRMSLYSRRMSETAQRQMAKLSEEGVTPTSEESALLKEWRWITTRNAGAAGILSFLALRCPPWPLSTFWAALVGGVASFAVAGGTAAREAPRIMAGMIEQRTESRLVDEAVCPAISELEACVKDPHCAAALRGASAVFRDAADVVDLLDRCRRRKERFPSGMTWDRPRNDGYSSSHGGVTTFPDDENGGVFAAHGDVRQGPGSDDSSESLQWYVPPSDGADDAGGGREWGFPDQGTSTPKD